MIEILSIGSGLTLQDHGRPGWRRFGVPSGGAMDQRSMALANELIGNPEDAPVLEIAQQGARICVLKDSWFALAGSNSCSSLASGTAMPLREGDVLNFDQKADGLYAYLAIPGGYKADLYLGSVSTDLRNGMGTPIKKGSRVESRRAQPDVLIDSVSRRISRRTQEHIPSQHAHFLLHPGPQFKAFSRAARLQFIKCEWRVSTRSDRTGYRLEGSPLEVPEAIPSEPLLPGSFQVTSGGQPIITMVDGPTVGGYAKIAVLKATDLDRLAQCAPGTKITFAWAD